MADPITNSTDNDRRITGRNAILKIGSSEVPVTNVSFDREVNTTEVQLNDSLKPTHAVTGLRYSGSFEYDGANSDILSKIFYSSGGTRQESGEPQRYSTLSVEETLDDGSTRTFTFKNVMITSQSRDLPSDDVASSSFDFIAEDLTVTT